MFCEVRIVFYLAMNYFLDTLQGSWRAICFHLASLFLSFYKGTIISHRIIDKETPKRERDRKKPSTYVYIHVHSKAIKMNASEIENK